MPPNRVARVLLADDHAILRQALRVLLETQGFAVVGEASDGHTAISLCRTLQPDVAVVDVSMPLLNGIDAAHEIAKQCPGTKVILLTMYSEHSYFVAALRAGIAGYVLKSGPASSLIQAIEAVLAGETYLSAGVSRMMVNAYLSTECTPVDPLSTREREVLQLIAEGKNMKEIGDTLGISARTAETHRARIMTKLNIHDVAGLVRYAIKTRLVNLDAGSSAPEFS